MAIGDPIVATRRRAFPTPLPDDDPAGRSAPGSAEGLEDAEPSRATSTIVSSREATASWLWWRPVTSPAASSL
jgi:hypothetical protein